MDVALPTDLARLLACEPIEQEAFVWSRTSWNSWLAAIDGAVELLSALPDALGRPGTVAAVQTELGAGRYATALIAAMAWGHGDSGYGPYRTACVLTGQRAPRGLPASRPVLDRLKVSAELTQTRGVVDAFRYLNNPGGHILGLGPAFFTKWLYFVSASEGHDSATVAPILDERVRCWLAHHADVRLQLGRTVDYAEYVALLTSWGVRYGRTPVQVETSIFRLARKDTSSECGRADRGR